MKRFSLVLVVLATLLFSTLAFATEDGNFLIGIANGIANSAPLPPVDTIVTLSNSGSSWGQPFAGIAGAVSTVGVPFPTAPTPVVFTGSGYICANVYVLSADEQLQECCSCPMSPNSIHSYSVITDLIANPVTGVPYSYKSAIIKIVASEQGPGVNGATPSGTCNPTNVNKVVQNVQIGQPLAGGLLAWERRDSTSEIPFVSASLSAPELTRLTNLCSFIGTNTAVGPASGHGICNMCHFDGQ